MALYDWSRSATGLKKPTRKLQADPFLAAAQGNVPGQQALGMPLGPLTSQSAAPEMRFPTALAAKSRQPLGGQVAPAQSAFGPAAGGAFGGGQQQRGGVQATYGSMGEFNQAAQQAGPGMWRGQTPLPGQGAGDWQQHAEGGGLEGLRQQLYLKPEAYAALTPAVAAALQGREEAAAQEQLGEKYAEAVERMDAPGTQPPDVEAQLPTTGFIENRIARERRRRIGEIDARLGMRQQALQEQATRGTASKEWLDHQMGILGRERNAAISKLNAQLSDQRDQLEMQTRQMNIGAMMDRYRAVAPEERMRAMAQAQLATQWPTAVTPWTNVEGYMRGARMDVRSMNPPSPIVVGPGGGGGGGGFGGPGQPPVGPKEGDTATGVPFPGQGIQRTARRNEQYLPPITPRKNRMPTDVGQSWGV